MPSNKSNYPEYVSSKSGQLYKRQDSEDAKPKKKNAKSVSKLSFDSDSEEEDTRKRTAKSPRQTDERREKKSSKTDRDDEAPRKKSSKTSRPEKAISKKRKVEVVDDSDSESGSEAEDTLPVPAAHLEKLKLARSEALTSEEMKTKTAEEIEIRYRQCKTFVKWYEKEYVPEKEEEKSAVEKADDLMTDAAATYKKVLGLEKAKDNIKPTKKINKETGEETEVESHLLKAIPKLRLKGENEFKQCLELVAAMSPEDAAAFWKLQERNRNAKCFEDLMTKKEYDNQKLVQSIREQVAAENKAAASNEEVEEQEEEMEEDN